MPEGEYITTLSISCKYRMNGSKNQKPMSAWKGRFTIISAFVGLILTGRVFAQSIPATDKTSNGESPATEVVNDDFEKVVKTAPPAEITPAKKVSTPGGASPNPSAVGIFEGHFGKAEAHSYKNKVFTVRIFGPPSAAQDIRQEAQAMLDTYANLEDFPRGIAVFCDIDNEYSVMGSDVLMNGYLYKTQSGASFFSPGAIKKNASGLSKLYETKYGK